VAGQFTFPEWLNSNSVRAYPLAENGSRLDITGTFKIPDSLIVAATINAQPEYSGKFFVSEVISLPDRISIGISYNDGVDSTIVANVVILAASHTEYKNYPFVGIDQHSSVIGSLSIGSLSDTINLATGAFSFTNDATSFEVNAIFFAVPAIKYIEVECAGTVTRFNKALKLKEGQNIRLTYEGDDVIRIDAIEGLNLTDPAQCTDALPVPGPIRTINGIAPDSNGNFILDPSDCLTIEAGTSKLILKDTCSKSCCGCNELEQLVTGLSSVESQLASLKTQIQSVESQQSQLIANLVASIA
jgi:hypothetical protein